MKKLIFSVLLLCATLYAQSLCNITLNLSNLVGGTTFTNTSVVFELKNYGSTAPMVPNTFFVIPTSTTFYPSSNGLISGQIWGNDNIVPNNTFYTITFYNAGSAYSSCNIILTGSSVNINTTSCIPYSSLPPSSVPDLNFYNNGTFVSNEPGLNIVPGTNITTTVVDNPSSKRVDVTINSSGGSTGGLQSNTVNNFDPFFTATYGSDPLLNPNLVFTSETWNPFSFIANNTSSSAIPLVVSFDTVFGNCATALTYSTTSHMFGCNSSSGALADPGSNGIVKRTALNVTTVAAFGDIVGLFGGGTCSGFLYFDGTCTAPGAGVVVSVSGTAPVVSSGGASPTISMPVSTDSVDGYLSGADHTTFNAKQPLLTSYMTIVSLWSACTGFLKNDGTCALSTGLSDPGSNGILKRISTNTTAIINYADIVGLFTSCIGTNYLGADGNCHAPSGGSGVTSVSGSGIASLFNLSVANSTTTPSITNNLVNQNPFTIFMNNSSSTNAPTWVNLTTLFPSCSGATQALQFNSSTKGFVCNSSVSGVTIQTNGVNNSIQTTLNHIDSTTDAIALHVAWANSGSTEKAEVTGGCTQQQYFQGSGSTNCVSIGLTARAVSGASDTVLLNDNSGLVEYSFSGSVAVALPTATTLGNSVFVTRMAAATGTTVTVTPATWTVNGASTLTVHAQEACSIYVSPAGSAWHAICQTSSQHP